MQYTIVESNGENLIRIIDDEGGEVLLTLESLKKSIIILEALSGNIQAPITRKENREVLNEIQKPIQKTVPKPAPIKNQPIDTNKATKFLSRIEAEQARCDDENDVRDEQRGQISETAIMRAIKTLYPSIDKKTMFVALNKSLGMEEEIFELTFNRSIKQEQEAIDDD